MACPHQASGLCTLHATAPAQLHACQHPIHSNNDYIATLIPHCRRRAASVVTNAQPRDSSSSSHSSGDPASSSTSSGNEAAWWDGMNRRSLQGPVPAEPPPDPTNLKEWSELRMGQKGYKRFEALKRDERQRGEPCNTAEVGQQCV